MDKVKIPDLIMFTASKTFKERTHGMPQDAFMVSQTQERLFQIAISAILSNPTAEMSFVNPKMLIEVSGAQPSERTFHLKSSKV